MGEQKGRLFGVIWGWRSRFEGARDKVETSAEKDGRPVNSIQ